MDFKQIFSEFYTKKRTSANIILGLLFSVLFFLTLFIENQKRSLVVQSELEEQGYLFSNDIYETLRISVENLQAASSVIVFFKNINHQQFNTITSSYFSSDLGLMIVEWQPVVSEEDRTIFVANAHRNGLPNFKLWEPNHLGKPILAKQRATHVPVLFMSSRDQTQHDVNTLGLDLAWSTQRMQSKLAARDTGRARASELFEIVTGQSNGYNPLGFAVSLPVYKNGVIPSSTEQRQSNLIGYMAGVYSLERLLEKNISKLTNKGINVEIYDHLDNENRLFVTAGVSTDYSHEMELDVFGNTLHFKLKATDSFVNSNFKSTLALLPLLILTCGLLTILFVNQLASKADSLAKARNELELLNVKLTELSVRDPLTNLYNRRAFLETLSLTLEGLKRNEQTIALLMIDLDFFKSVNDNWGHPVGDDVLKAFAETCQTHSRNVDMIGRLGGEEFAMLLTNTSNEEALSFAHRLRKIVEELKIPIRHHSRFISVTVSIGITITNQSIAENQLLEQADKALYKAKSNGRNRVAEI